MDYTSWGDAFISSLQSVWYKIALFLPQLIGAIIIFIVGWLISKFLGWLVEYGLKLARVDRLVEKSGLHEEMMRLGIHASFSRVVGKIVKWFFIIVTLIAVTDILKIPEVSNFLSMLASYLPNVLAAVVIIAIGLMLARFVHGLVEGAFKASNQSDAVVKTTGMIARWSIIIFAFMAALVQLRIAESLIQILFAGLIIMLALAGGLAFGLGGKEKASDFLNSINLAKIKRNGGNQRNGRPEQKNIEQQ